MQNKLMRLPRIGAKPGYLNKWTPSSGTMHLTKPPSEGGSNSARFKHRNGSAHSYHFVMGKC
ncbi:hypothetical protein [Paracoccus litorisediminis]|uniref:Uncharacterized protein n=1 Tax=Paracoccus litorisediminis TaxID=2006130 RepID=A0A844HR24_9RHOB|nr:hypothetical protein [Paracoccus litorisediminis]MTH60042.1 hypothetical protein [Paracoccus litorisediminis]